MDKKQYEEVQIEVIKFTSKDVITTSPFNTNDVTDPQNPNG